MRDVTEYNEIPELLKQGNSKRLTTLILKLREETMLYLTRSFGVAAQEAEEYAQQALYGLLEQSLRRENGFANTYGYVMASARNNYFLRYKETKRFTPCDNFELDVATRSLPDDSYILQETKDLVDKCIEKMPVRYKTVVKLYMEFPDLHYKKAAKMLGVSGINLRTMKSRGFERLRKEMEKRAI